MKIGVCVMKNKLNKPHAKKLFDIIKTYPGVMFFDDNTILNDKIVNWTQVDILVSFYHKHLPFEKVYKYSKLRNVFYINNLLMQYALLDRRIVHRILKSLNIPTPEHLIVNRQTTKLSDDLKKFLHANNLDCDLSISSHIKEEDNYIEVNDQRLYKPFIEKPADAENHNIYIYYADGSVRRLFRKRNNISSEIDHTIKGIRKNGNYIYEQFYEPDNSKDIKVYAIGKNIAYAEARKAPSVDGIVERCEIGFEKRNVLELTADECEYAKKITIGFKQFICGFDIIRVDGKSYVIDVNGWSFVKNSDIYYDLCTKSLFQEFDNLKNKKEAKRFKKIVRIYRHGDRTPKQKLKIKIKECVHLEEKEMVFRDNFDAIIELLESYKSEKLGEILLVLKEIKHEKGIKFQIKCTKDYTEIILKWGGLLTHTGRNQARELAEEFYLYVNQQSQSIMKNINIYSSNESRVNESAKIFISVFSSDNHEVIIDETLLDKTFHANGFIETGRESTKTAFEGYRNKEDDEIIYNTIYELDTNKWINQLNTSVTKRWQIIKNKFNVSNNFTHTLISEMVDNLKFDLIHNNSDIKKMFENRLESFYKSTSKYYKFIVSTEYGKYAADKIATSKAISGDLLRKIMLDFSSNDGINIYFTKESRIYTLFNLLNNIIHKDSSIEEFEYGSMIELSTYEKNGKTRVCVKYNKGVSTAALLHGPVDSRHNIMFCRNELLCDITLEEFNEFFKELFN